MGGIKRQSLPQQLAQKIREDIQQGIWKGSLPGYRVLTEYYSVSKITCERAFKLLEVEKVIAPAVPRKQRQIIQLESKAQPGASVLLIICDIAHKTDPDVMRQINGVSAFWERRGGTSLVKEVDYLHGGKPEKLLKKWTAPVNVAAVYLYSAPRAWASAIEATGCPMFCAGGEGGSPSGESTHCGIDIAESFGAILRHLKNLGHHRILIPWKLNMTMLRSYVIDVFKSVYSDTLTDSQIENAVPINDFNTPEDWKDYWPKQLPAYEPSVVVLTKPMEAFSLVSYCAHMGIRIPKHLSVLVSDYSYEIEWITPKLTHIKVDEQVELGIFADWVRSGFVPRGKIRTPLQLMDGASLLPYKSTDPR